LQILRVRDVDCGPNSRTDRPRVVSYQRFFSAPEGRRFLSTTGVFSSLAIYFDWNRPDKYGEQ
jgi:hypothetical protein